jgi:tRNA(fMet)-specific endonuclease VapC
MKWMLDTDTCTAIIKKHLAALKKLRGKSIGQVGFSSITLGELTFGANRSNRSKDAHNALREFALALEIAAFDEDAAMQYGPMRAELARRGKPTGALDYIDRRARWPSMQSWLRLTCASSARSNG